MFEARQKRFTYDEENFYVDLVFYNRLLRCYVMIDIIQMLLCCRRLFIIQKMEKLLLKKPLIH